MAGRIVGEGRGSVFVGGVRYDEGAEIPKDVDVDESVFSAVAEDGAPVGNVAASAAPVVTAEDKAASKSKG